MIVATATVTIRSVRERFVRVYFLWANDRHQRMAGEEYLFQDANYRHSAAWDCSHLRFIAICDSSRGDFAARSLPDQTQMRCQVTTVRATWQVHRSDAAEILCGIIVHRLTTFDTKLTCQFIPGLHSMPIPSVLVACESRLDRRAKSKATRVGLQQANA